MMNHDLMTEGESDVFQLYCPSLLVVLVTSFVMHLYYFILAKKLCYKKMNTRLLKSIIIIKTGISSFEG